MLNITVIAKTHWVRSERQCEEEVISFNPGYNLLLEEEKEVRKGRVAN